MPTNDLHTAYAELKAEGESLAGDLLDIRRRAMILHNLYLDSGQNHVFSLIAAHGALWAYRYFEVGGRLGRFIAYRYFYNPTERMFRLGLLNSFAEGFRRVNRLVCIDTYANYYFTQRYGEQSGAADLIHPELLEALNRVHAARKAERQLTEDEKQQVFQMSFKWEQEVTVAPGVADAVSGFDCRILRGLCLKPVVRFAFFPPLSYLFFRDFSSKEERISKGHRTYGFGCQAGWKRVADSLAKYRLLDPEFFKSPREHLKNLESKPLTALRND